MLGFLEEDLNDEVAIFGLEFVRSANIQVFVYTILKIQEFVWEFCGVKLMVMGDEMVIGRNCLKW